MGRVRVGPSMREVETEAQGGRRACLPTKWIDVFQVAKRWSKEAGQV